MKLVKLPDGQWVRAVDVALIEPSTFTTTGDKGETIVTSKLAIIVETSRSARHEFLFDYPDKETAFKLADELANEIMKTDYRVGGIQYTNDPHAAIGYQASQV